MKGKYITTSLMLAVLSGGKEPSVLVDETAASVTNHELIWSKTVAAAKKTMQEMADRDELKIA